MDSNLIGPEIWGKYIWHTIHYVALGYPSSPSENDKNMYRLFFMNMGDVIPCESCSKGYKHLLQKHPLTDDILKSPIQLFEWTVNLHNSVNTKLQKRELSVAQALKLHTMGGSCKLNGLYLAVYVVSALLAGALLGYAICALVRTPRCAYSVRT